MTKRDLNNPMAAAVLASLALFVPSVADAHFVLEEPASWRELDALGNPQKLGPCGDDGSAATTGAITAFQTGQTITITIHETIFHPGHYRVALAVNDRSELPPEPLVTPASTPCGSVPIMDPPVFPVLADGALLHTAPFSGPQSFDVTLPAGVTCTHCTLQIIEFMSNHGLNVPGGCFYHHCADISIQDVVVQPDAAMSIDSGAAGLDAGSTTGTDAGSTTGSDAGTSAPVPQACACSAPGRRAASGTPALGMLLIAGLGLARRRRFFAC